MSCVGIDCAAFKKHVSVGQSVADIKLALSNPMFDEIVTSDDEEEDAGSSKASSDGGLSGKGSFPRRTNSSDDTAMDLD